MILRIFLFLFHFFLFSQIDNSLKNEALEAVLRAEKFLITKQNKNGSWGEYNGDPGYTALACIALSLDDIKRKEYKFFLQKGIDYLISCIKPNGSIVNPDFDKYVNYSTSLGIKAIYIFNPQKYKKIILKGRYFLKKSQFGSETGIEAGGIGYGSNKNKSDLSNTQMALETLFITQSIEDEEENIKSLKLTKEVWQNAKNFLKRCQALHTNKLEWVKKLTKEEKGGFIYSPDRTMVNSEKLRPYGSMTYAGFKSMIFAGFLKESKEVQAAFNWLKNHYDIENNPGLGKEGYYYYLHLMAKSLYIYNEDTLETKKGKIFWKKTILKKMLSLQHYKGYWVNKEKRWQESNPVLTSCYALMTIFFTIQ